MHEFGVPNMLTVGEEYDGVRVDKYISDMVPDMSRSYIQKLIKDGNVSIGDKKLKSNYKVSYNDTVTIIFPEPQKLDIVPENIDIDIVYEDNDIIVVNKDKDMVVHPAPGHYTGTLVNALLYHCGDNLSGINGVMRPGIVHRIDKDTTGLLIVCKNDIAHNKIAAQLAEHSITRKYHALVTGNIKDESGTIDKPIYRHPVDRKKMAIVPDGKRAVTHYKVLNRYITKNKAMNLTYVECQLETGRTHQIRVHMSSISHPLVGDTIYGSEKQLFKTNGQVLHAKTLGIIHPTTEKYIEFDSELPDYFVSILNSLEIK